MKKIALFLAFGSFVVIGLTVFQNNNPAESDGVSQTPESDKVQTLLSQLEKDKRLASWD